MEQAILINSIMDNIVVYPSELILEIINLRYKQLGTLFLFPSIILLIFFKNKVSIFYEIDS